MLGQGCRITEPDSPLAQASLSCGVTDSRIIGESYSSPLSVATTQHMLDSKTEGVLVVVVRYTVKKAELGESSLSYSRLHNNQGLPMKT
jgi:hypothetical protein